MIEAGFKFPVLLDCFPSAGVRGIKPHLIQHDKSLVKKGCFHIVFHFVDERERHLQLEAGWYFSKCLDRSLEASQRALSYPGIFSFWKESFLYRFDRDIVNKEESE